MTLSTTRKGNTMIKTFDDAVKLERVPFAQPFNEAYEIVNGNRCVKIVLDDYSVHYVRRECKSGKWVLMGRKEFETANKQLCVKNAIKWVNAK
nr:MAG TPA: hypothetical protein [Caudoviricetes sp.]